MLSENCILRTVHRKGDSSQVLECLNPYAGNANLALVLDLISQRGVGLALKALAFLEVDVHNNWRPMQPGTDYDEEAGTLQVTKISYAWHRTFYWTGCT